MLTDARHTKTKVYVGDFETTVFEGQTFTEVWASALVQMYSEDVVVVNSIGKTYDYLVGQKCNCVVYYHNLKFDGEFWLYYLVKVLGFSQACVIDEEEPSNTTWIKPKEMPDKSLVYTISDRGQWYKITFKVNGKLIELRDSLKLLPFSVKEIGRSFKTKHQKSEIEYKGVRHAGGKISPEEQEYIKNDVLVVKEALEFMYEQGHKRLTIGSCCLTEYKNIIGADLFKAMFPNLLEYPLDESVYGASNADRYIRKSYKGGWCYVVTKKANQRKKNGLTADVNSLYPSMMHSQSGNRFPVGYPRGFWSGNEIPEKALRPTAYFFIRIRTRFYLKKDKLPFIQIKGNLLYKSTQCLETSDYYDRKTGKYHRWLMKDGKMIPTTVELTLTCTDYYLFLEHYNVEDFEILDGCWFNTDIGIFDEYINRYKEIKMNSKGAMRTLAKLFLNNLYGKLATNDNSSFKLLIDKNEEEIGFIPIPQHDKPIVYIPAGSAVTSYARNFTIRAAQANYYGADKHGFIYADTDSIHCDIPIEELKGVTIDDKDFCCWKVESLWDEAIFTRQKTYIEHVIAEDLKPIDSPYYSIKCAGMPDRCKNLLSARLTNKTFTNEEKMELSDDAIDFLFDDDGNTKPMELEDFKIGIRIPGKLLPKRIRGGIVLTDTEFTMRG